MDSKYYDETAQGIASGSLLQREAFFMGPLYPYFLSLVYLVFGRDFMIVRVLQVLAGAASVALTFAIGKQIFRPSAALLGALLLMLYGTTTFYEGLILMTWLGTILNRFAGSGGRIPRRITENFWCVQHHVGLNHDVDIAAVAACEEQGSPNSQLSFQGTLVHLDLIVPGKGTASPDPSPQVQSFHDLTGNASLQ